MKVGITNIQLYTAALYSFTMLFATFGCSTQDLCRESTYVSTGISFYKISASKITHKDSISTLIIDSITVRGVKDSNEPMDSILYDNKKKLAKIILPLNKFAPKTRFLFTLNNITDTLTIYHRNDDQYISLECGAIKVFTIDSLRSSQNFIDSLSIKNINVNTTTAEHVQVFHSVK